MVFVRDGTRAGTYKVKSCAINRAKLARVLKTAAACSAKFHLKTKEKRVSEREI